MVWHTRNTNLSYDLFSFVSCDRRDIHTSLYMTFLICNLGLYFVRLTWFACLKRPSHGVSAQRSLALPPSRNKNAKRWIEHMKTKLIGRNLRIFRLKLIGKYLNMPEAICEHCIFFYLKFNCKKNKLYSFYYCAYGFDTFLFHTLKTS